MKRASIFEFDGVPSNEVTVNLTQEQIDNRTDQKPAAPVVTAVPGDNKITLNWTYDKTSGTVPVYYKITRYNLMDKTTGNTITISGDGETFTYTDQLVEPGVRYCYEIMSWNSSYATSGNDVYATALGETKDQAAAAYVSTLIGALPEASNVTIGSTGPKISVVSTSASGRMSSSSVGSMKRTLESVPHFIAICTVLLMK